jgi:O-antigen ligase
METNLLSPVGLLLLVVPLLLLVWLCRWFVALERDGQAVVVVTFIVGLLLVESVLWGSQQGVPDGPFNPRVGGFSFRLYEVLIPVALLARCIARGAPRRIGWVGLMWLVFAAWYVARAVAGLIAGFDTIEVFFEAKTILYLVGGFALAGGVPVGQYIEHRRTLLRLALPFALVAAVLSAMSQNRLFVNLGIPGLELEEFGRVGADTASIFVVLGLLSLAVVAATRRPSLLVVGSAVVLCVTAFTAEQRAAVIGLVVSIGILAIAMVLPSGRRRFKVTVSEIFVVALLGVALVLTPVLVAAILGRDQAELPLSSTISETFGGVENAQSANERVAQFESAREIISQRPLFGWGLGQSISYYSIGTRSIRTIPISHNIVTDLLIRSGIIGLVFFLVPLGMTVAGGFRVYRRHPDDRIAAFALACTALILGLIAKGLVESIFEKYRLAVTMGLLLGMMHSAALSLAARERAERGALVRGSEPAVPA